MSLTLCHYRSLHYKSRQQYLQRIREAGHTPIKGYQALSVNRIKQDTQAIQLTGNVNYLLMIIRVLKTMTKCEIVLI